MKKLITLIVCFVILLSVVACSKPADTMPTDAPFPTSKLSGEDADITPMPQNTLVSSEIIELDRLDEPKVREGGNMNFLDVDELFSLCSYVVYGKIVSAQEIMYKREYSEGNSSEVYSTVLDVEVIKSYGKQELKHKTDGNIRIDYSNSTHEFFECGVDFSEGDECIFFLSDTNKIRLRFDNDFFEYVPYMVFGYNECIIEKTNEGFNAYGLMALENGEEYYYSNDDERTTKFYTLEEIEAVIIPNVDKLLGLDYQKYIENYFLKRQPEETDSP